MTENELYQSYVPKFAAMDDDKKIRLAAQLHSQVISLQKQLGQAKRTLHDHFMGMALLQIVPHESASLTAKRCRRLADALMIERDSV